MSRASNYRIAFSVAIVVFLWTLSPRPMAQVFPPGGFAIDGIPVSCGALPTVLTTNIPDAAMNNGQVILINPAVVGSFPHELKLWAYAHECGHAFVSANEIAADCWAITAGKQQGWFPPRAFNYLVQLFANNPGNLSHPPGPVRIQAMMQCYQNNWAIQA